jgi:hypothetical protein
MTREEYEELLGESWEEDSKAKSLYISSLEARITELESPKTCAGCKYYHVNAYMVCMHCTRDEEDLYEPKDT